MDIKIISVQMIRGLTTPDIIKFVLNYVIISRLPTKIKEVQITQLTIAMNFWESTEKLNDNPYIV